MSTPAVVRALVESAFRDFETAGVPASGDREPVKSEIRAALGVALETALSSVGSGLLRFATVALMNADVAQADGALAYVFNNNDDPGDAANGVYQWDDGATDWVLAEWYFAALVAVVQPLIDEAEAFRDDAEQYAAATEATIRAGAALYAQALQSIMVSGGNPPPRGPVILADYGITDYDNDYDILLWSDGSKIWPMKPVDNTFKTGWREGGHVYRDLVAGVVYESVSLARMDDPTAQGTAFNTYYVNYALGTDGGAGTATGAGAWKTVTYAQTNATSPALIIVEGDNIGINCWPPNTYAINKTIKFKAAPTTAGRTRSWVTQMFEGIPKADFAWQDNGDGSWDCNVADATIYNGIKSARQFDLADLDPDGSPAPLQPVASRALARATPGSVFNNTATSPHTLTVHLRNGEEPDPGVNWAYCYVTAALAYTPHENRTLFWENFDWIRNDGAADTEGLRVFPQGLVLPGPHVIHTSRAWLKNCGMYGPRLHGVHFYDVSRGGAEGYTGKHIGRDRFALSSYHHSGFLTGPVTLGGSYCHIIDMDGVGEHLGYDPTAGLGPSANGSTVHDQGRMTRLNLRVGNTYGSVIADVGGSRTLNVACFAFDPVNTHSNAIPQAAFWADGVASEGSEITTQNTLLCGSRVPPTGYDFAATAGAISRYSKHRETPSVFTHGGGTVTDVTP